MQALESLLTYLDISNEDTTYHKMVRTILDNLDVVRNGTIYDTAALCYTSTTSIGRLCSRLGYDSYASFRNAVSNALEDYEFSGYILSSVPTSQLSADQIQELIARTLRTQSETLQQIDLSTLERISDLLASARCVHFFSPMLDPYTFLSLQTSLILSGKQSYLNCGNYNHMASAIPQISEEDVALLIIPNHQRWAYMNKIFYQLRDKKVPTVLLVTREKSCWDGATIRLCLPGQNSLMDGRLYGSVLDLISCLYRQKLP